MKQMHRTAAKNAALLPTPISVYAEVVGRIDDLVGQSRGQMRDTGLKRVARSLRYCPIGLSDYRCSYSVYKQNWASSAC